MIAKNEDFQLTLNLSEQQFIQCCCVLKDSNKKTLKSHSNQDRKNWFKLVQIGRNCKIVDVL